MNATEYSKHIQFEIDDDRSITIHDGILNGYTATFEYTQYIWLAIYNCVNIIQHWLDTGRNIGVESAYLLLHLACVKEYETDRD